MEARKFDFLCEGIHMISHKYAYLISDLVHSPKYFNVSYLNN